MARMKCFAQRVLSESVGDDRIQAYDAQFLTTNVFVCVVKRGLLFLSANKISPPQERGNDENYTYSSSPVRLSSAVRSTVATSIKQSTRILPTRTRNNWVHSVVHSSLS